MAEQLEHLLLLERTEIQFPSNTVGWLTLPVTPAPEDLIYSSDFLGIHTHMAYTHKHTHTFKT